MLWWCSGPCQVLSDVDAEELKLLTLSIAVPLDDVELY